MPDPTTDPDDDADLIAYLDGELGGPDADAVEARMARDEEARAKAEAYRKTYDLLDYLPRADPSPDFTNRTLTKLDPVAVGSSPSAPKPFPAVTAAAGGRSFRGLAWVAAGVIAVGGGYLAHAALRPPPGVTALDADEPTLADLRVIEHLPLYLGVDDIGFVRQLDAPDLFAPNETSDAPLVAVPPGLSAGGRDLLIARFRGYPLARQQQLRQLDQQLADLPPADRGRLFAVLDGYAVWLDRLPDPDRSSVLIAATPAERMDAIRRVRERLWRDALPPRSKDQLKQATDPEDRVTLTAKWKQAEAARRAEWAAARRQWDEVVRDPAAKTWPFSDPALAGQVDDFIRTVFHADFGPRFDPKADVPAACRLTREELIELKIRQEMAARSGYWLLYGACLYRLADRHPGLPEPGGKPPVTEFTSLPADVLREFRRVKAGSDLRRAHVSGRWPDYALDVVGSAQRNGVLLPEPLGPCRPGEFQPAVDGFLADTLTPVLTVPEAEALKKLEGKWPEYPRQLVELAKRHDLSVPGVTLPGKPSQWAKVYLPGS